MKRLRAGSATVRSGLVLIAMVAVAGGLVAGQRMIAGRAFDALEAQTVSGDANRVAVALTYEIRLLSNYGATNAIWDSSYTDVSTGDAAAFAADFPPADLVRLYDVDGVAGVDQDGRVLVGGQVSGAGYQPLPPELTPSALREMADAGAAAGVATCGAVQSSAVPYLYCGFSARRTDGSRTRPVALIFLRRLDAGTVQRLSRSTGLQLDLATAPSGPATVRLDTPLGTLTAGTTPLSNTRLVLHMSVPALDGRQLAMSSVRRRPIHATDQRTAILTLLLLGLGGLILAALVLVLVRTNLRARVRPLRTTTAAIIASGDQTLRVPVSGAGEVARLGGTINSMLDALAEQTGTAEHERAAAAARATDSHHRQQQAEAKSRDRAQALIDSTVQEVVAELATVLEQATSVQTAAAAIDLKTAEAGTVTSSVLHDATDSERALAELIAEMDKVRGITSVITQIASQTRMLALNATIEAARAGRYGTGFAVVADEVKQLADSTAASAGQITDTTTAVSTVTGEVASTIAAVTSGVSVIGAASAAVSDVAHQQTQTVRSLVEAVRVAVARVESMSSLTTDLERRVNDRVSAVGGATLQTPQGSTVAELRDVSPTGLQVRLGPGHPVSAGQQVTVTLPGTLDGHTLTSVVSWARADGVGTLAGLRFVDPSPGYLATVRRLRPGRG